MFHSWLAIRIFWSYWTRIHSRRHYSIGCRVTMLVCNNLLFTWNLKLWAASLSDIATHCNFLSTKPRGKSELLPVANDTMYIQDGSVHCVIVLVLFVENQIPVAVGDPSRVILYVECTGQTQSLNYTEMRHADNFTCSISKCLVWLVNISPWLMWDFRVDQATYGVECEMRRLLIHQSESYDEFHADWKWILMSLVEVWSGGNLKVKVGRQIIPLLPNL